MLRSTQISCWILRSPPQAVFGSTENNVLVWHAKMQYAAIQPPQTHVGIRYAMSTNLVIPQVAVGVEKVLQEEIIFTRETREHASQNTLFVLPLVTGCHQRGISAVLRVPTTSCADHLNNLGHPRYSLIDHP